RWTALLALAPALSPRVLQLAFVFLVVGYGTKAGLAPMHTWLPDAHSEAPAPVSALMSGVLLSVGVYAIVRFKPIVDAAAGPAFARRILIALGLLSLAVAAAFLWNPGNYKRMLAYSSVEHIGLVGLGLGFGGALGVSGALLHVANHGLAKSVVFLLAGRIRAAYGTVDLAGVRGLLRALPITGRAFLVAVLALMGLPPFGLFTSEVMIFAAGFREGHGWAAAAGLVLLVVAFAGLLLAAHGLEPQWIAAADTRATSGDFTLAYRFAPPTHRPAVTARAAVDAERAAFPSLATRSFAASRFEREIADLFGLVPTGHPDPRRLALHQFWPEGYHPLRRDAVARTDVADDGRPFPFRHVEGSGIFEITVGPVHAGIIEPGHFRFSVEGETIVNLETRLGFVHK